MDPDGRSGEETGGVQGGKTIIGVLCGGKSIFNERGNKECETLELYLLI